MTARILVIEDDNIVAMEIQYTLETLGYEIADVAGSAQAAIEKAAALAPDLVLMDIRLKGVMDGVEAASEIRTQYDIPVVYLTAYADDDTLRRAKITEPFGYIIKPFEERELHTAIEMALYKHKMERKLKVSERWLTTTLKSIGDGVLATDAQGLVSFMNPVAEALTGWRLDEALGQRVADVFHTLDRETRTVSPNPVDRLLQNISTIESPEAVLQAQDGTEIPIDLSASPIIDEQERVQGVVLVFRDITERKAAEEEQERLQAQLYQAQRMEAIGVLAAGIAHDFNNLMTTIIGYSSLMLSDLSDSDRFLSGVDYIRRAGERAASLTKQILALSRRQASQPRVLDLNIVLADMEEMLQHLVGDEIELTSSLQADLGCIQGDPAQLEQVIINLVVNACEALPEGGRIAVETRIVSLDEDDCQLLPSAYPGTFVCLSVTDNGTGMDRDTLDRIFEPFFTTREKGTGLGLSIAQNVVAHHNGWIAIASELGQGSKFEIYLPAVFTDVEYEEAEIAPLPELLGEGERILLVEDDEGVRAAVSEMLRAGGYQVVEVASVRQALDAFEAAEVEFDLVFSDVVLPDGNGLELIDRLAADKPGLPVLLASGYTDQRSQWPIIRDRGLCFLQKPFSLSDLLPVVRKVLEATGGSAVGL